jgi:hypothetical protein
MTSRTFPPSRGRPHARAFLCAVLLFVTIALLATSGCSIGGSTPTLTAPTSLVYLQTTIVAATNQAITTDTPSVTGTVTTFSVNPALPTGLSLNPTTGTISGTPTVVTPQATYSITAANSAGSATATVQITVNAAVVAPSNLVYPQTSITATAGQAIIADTPTVIGTVTTFSVSPALPAGLSLNPTTGTISGTPTAVTPQATYTVTAANSAGSATATVQITVNAAVVAPSNLVYPQTGITATAGQAIIADTPTVIGTVTTFSVSPALPAGLSLNTTTGTIFGTPTAVAAQATYTVTATNSAGSITATVQVAVIAPVVAPSALTYPQTTITATVSQQITTDTPTITGTTPTFAVAPALPAGLSINGSTGAIFGTPNAAAVLASYTVTASNSAGSTTAILSITVNPPTAAPSNLAYPQATISTAAGLPISTDIPSVTGTVFSFTVAPTLPAGLTLDNVTGAISGTPTAAAAQATYTVTAANSLGSTTASVVITIGKAVTTLLDLGHGTYVTFIRSTSNRLLSLDANGHWVLWDYATSAELASGDQIGVLKSPLAGSPTYPLGVDIAGSTVAIALPNGLELRSSIDGHLFTTIASSFLNPPVASGYWWKLAADGTYVCGGTKAGMAVWDISGNLLASRQGDYSTAKAFAAPGQVQIALGPAGANVIETISTSNGTSSTGPVFSGNFNSWFYDGQRFLTNLGTTVWTYSAASVQQGTASLPSFQNLAGNGNWFYTYSNSSTDPLIIYPVGGSVASSTIPFGQDYSVIAASNSLGIFNPVTGAVGVVDLSGSTPVKADYPATVHWPLAFTANSANQWAVGGDDGVILDGASISPTARYFGYGQVRSIAANSSYIALALGNGTIPYFSTSSLDSVNTINSYSSSLAMSSTGSVLAALSGSTLNIYSLPSGSVSSSWPPQGSAGTFPLSTFTMSADGSTLGLIFVDPNSGHTTREVVPTAGGAAIWSDSPSSSFGFIQLSPDGSMFAVSDYFFSARLFTGGQVTASLPGNTLGWIGSSHFLTNVFNSQGAYTLYSGNAIYDKTGTLTSKVNIPLIPLNSVVPGGGNYPGPVYYPPTSVLPISSSSIYYPPQNTIYSLTTGSPLYTSPLTSTGVGAIAGSQVVFATNNRVVVDTY